MSSDDDKKDVPTKNPFIPRKQTAIRRSKEEAYPNRPPNLLKPEFLGSSPLDKLFQNLDIVLDIDNLDGCIRDFHCKLFESKDSILLLENDMRYQIVEKLFDYLLQIRDLSLLSSNKHVDKNLIAISLHDMKILGKLLNFIIIMGVYPATSAFGLGIPIEQRRLNFNKATRSEFKFDISKHSNLSKRDTDPAFYVQLLQLICIKFEAVFSKESDVRSLLLKGTGYSDFLITTLTLATVPTFSQDIRDKYMNALPEVTSIPSTFELYQIYTVLLASPCPQYFRSFILQLLQTLPYNAVKGDGLLTLIEFVLDLRENQDVSIEKVDQVANILLAKPKSIATQDYFLSMGSQTFDLLVNINRPIICSTLVHFINKLWLKNSRVVQDFFFAQIQSCFCPAPVSGTLVVSSEARINNAVNTLISLSKPGLCSEAIISLFSPIWHQLWAYYTFCKSHERPYTVMEDILLAVLVNLNQDHTEAFAFVKKIATNLNYENENGLTFRVGPNQLIEIGMIDNKLAMGKSSEMKALELIESIDRTVKVFCGFLKRLDFNLTQKLFLTLLSKWATEDSEISSLEENPFMNLVDLKIVEQIAISNKDELSKTPYDSLNLILSILSRNSDTKKKSADIDMTTTPDSDDEDDEEEQESSGKDTVLGRGELFDAVIELLTVILLETSASLIDAKSLQVLALIEKKIETYIRIPRVAEVVSRIGELANGTPLENDESRLQRRKLEQALADVNDSLVPVRAQGLLNLQELAMGNTNVVSIEFVVKTHITQLSDPDPFVFMNAIKGLERLLSVYDEKIFCTVLTSYAGGDKNFSTIEDRLKLGEVFLRYVQRQGEAFGGPSASKLVATLLSMIRVSSSSLETETDDRLRASAMSLLGMCFKTNVLGVASHIEDALDCVIGVLQLETSAEKTSMRRSAIVLIHDLVLGTSLQDKIPFPETYRQKVLLVLVNTQEKDLDILVRNQAKSVLEFINELVKLALS